MFIKVSPQHASILERLDDHLCAVYAESDPQPALSFSPAYCERLAAIIDCLRAVHEKSDQHRQATPWQQRLAVFDLFAGPVHVCYGLMKAIWSASGVTIPNRSLAICSIRL